jgi:hypothetical protein
MQFHAGQRRWLPFLLAAILSLAKSGVSTSLRWCFAFFGINDAIYRWLPITSKD